MLADDGHVDGDLSPLFHLYPGKAGRGGSFVGQGAHQLAGLTAGAKVRQNGNNSHFDLFSGASRVLYNEQRGLINDNKMEFLCQFCSKSEEIFKIIETTVRRERSLG
jgi:hypothetical protein